MQIYLAEYADTTNVELYTQSSLGTVLSPNFIFTRSSINMINLAFIQNTANESNVDLQMVFNVTNFLAADWTASYAKTGGSFTNNAFTNNAIGGSVYNCIMDAVAFNIFNNPRARVAISNDHMFNDVANSFANDINSQLQSWALSIFNLYVDFRGNLVNTNSTELTYANLMNTSVYMYLNLKGSVLEAGDDIDYGFNLPNGLNDITMIAFNLLLEVPDEGPV